MGPDGLTGKFFQYYLDIVGSNIPRIVHDLFSTKSLPKSITHTNLLLIKKKNNQPSLIKGQLV